MAVLFLQTPKFLEELLRSANQTADDASASHRLGSLVVVGVQAEPCKVVYKPMLNQILDSKDGFRGEKNMFFIRFRWVFEFGLLDDSTVLVGVESAKRSHGTASLLVYYGFRC